MPIISVYMSEGPNYSIQAKTVRDSRISENILIIIIVDELVLHGWAKYSERNHYEKDRDEPAITVRNRLRCYAASCNAFRSDPFPHGKIRYRIVRSRR